MLALAIIFFVGFAFISLELDKASVKHATKETEKVHREYYEWLDENVGDPLVRSREKAYADKLIKDAWRDSGVKYNPEVPLPKEQNTVLHPDEAEAFRNACLRQYMSLDRAERMARWLYPNDWENHVEEWREKYERLDKIFQEAQESGELERILNKRYE